MSHAQTAIGELKEELSTNFLLVEERDSGAKRAVRIIGGLFGHFGGEGGAVDPLHVAIGIQKVSAAEMAVFDNVGRPFGIAF